MLFLFKDMSVCALPFDSALLTGTSDLFHFQNVPRVSTLLTAVYLKKTLS